MDAKWTRNTTHGFLNISAQNSPAISVAGLTTAYAVLLLLSLLGNILVLVIIYRDRRLRTNVNLFIANMAASDLLFPTFAVPYRISSILSGGKWIVHGVLGEALCKTVTFTGDISNLVSVLCLVAIAADRFDAIVYPMSSQRITKKVRSVILISTWILAVLFFCPYFYAMQLRPGKNNATECLFTWGTDAETFSFQRIYFFVNFAFFIALPFLLLIALYSIIIFSLVRQSLSLVLSTKERKQHMNENRQIALMSFIVVVVFILTYTPFNIFVFIIFVNGADFTFNQTFLFVSTFLSLVYPAVNPIIYYFFHEKYRQGFHRIFRFCCKFYNREQTKCSRLKQLERGISERQTIELVEFLNYN